jgi:hypothetical protein
MQTRRAVAVIALLASLSFAAATALAASPKKGAHFTGTATGQVKFATSFAAKDPLSFAILSNGKQLSGFAYTDNACGLGASKLIELGTIELGAGGRFSLSKKKSAPEKDATEDGGTVVTTSTLSGRFVSAAKATGTLEYTQTQSGASTAHCGPIKLKFTASA